MQTFPPVPKFLIGFILLLFLSLFVFQSRASASGPLVFTPLPLTNPERVVAESRNLAEYLAMVLGRKVQVRFEPDYAAILERFARDEIDLVHLGPLPFAILRAMAPQAEPVVFFRDRDGDTTYCCALAAAVDLGKGEPLRGPVALTQPLSTCGFFATAGLLHRSGHALDRMPHAYLGSHEAVALALVRGEYPVGGLRASIGESYTEIGLHLLDQTIPLPGFALVANGKTLGEESLERLRRELVQVSLEQPDRLAGWVGLGRWGMAPVRLTDYCALRDFLEPLEQGRSSLMTNCGGLDCTLIDIFLEETCREDP